MRGTLVRSLVPSMKVTPSCVVRLGRTGQNPKNRDNPQLTRLPDCCQSWAVQRSLRCGSIGFLPMCLRSALRPSERMRPSTDPHRVEKWPGLSFMTDWYHGTGLWQPSVHSDVAFLFFDFGLFSLY